MAVNLLVLEKTRRNISDNHIDKEAGTRAYGESLKEWSIAPRLYLGSCRALHCLHSLLTYFLSFTGDKKRCCVEVVFYKGPIWAMCGP